MIHVQQTQNPFWEGTVRAINILLILLLGYSFSLSAEEYTQEALKSRRDFYQQQYNNDKQIYDASGGKDQNAKADMEDAQRRRDAAQSHIDDPGFGGGTSETPGP